MLASGCVMCVGRYHTAIDRFRQIKVKAAKILSLPLLDESVMMPGKSLSAIEVVRKVSDVEFFHVCSEMRPKYNESRTRSGGF